MLQFEMFSIAHNRFLNQLTFCNEQTHTQKKRLFSYFSCEDWFTFHYELEFREVSAVAETKSKQPSSVSADCF